MKKILIPFDDSDNALHAVQYAVTLVHDIPSLDLELLCVLAPVPRRSHAGLDQTEIQRLYFSETATIMEPARQTLQQYDISCEQHCRVDDAATEIASQGHEKDIDAVIMGMHCMGQIANLMIGSMPTRVVHLLKVPVTLVK
jgi:nucleotide-binding universal stress UspA family protein